MRDQTAGPQAAIRRWIIERAVKALALFGVEQRSGAGVEAAQIAQPVNPGLVIPSDKNADPALRIPGHLGRDLRRPAACQQPEDLEMRALDRVLFFPIPMIQLIGSQDVQSDKPCFPCSSKWKPNSFIGTLHPPLVSGIANDNSATIDSQSLFRVYSKTKT